MLKKKAKPKFHPRAPIKLKRMWKEYPAYNRIAKYLDVNVNHVWKALKKGEHPINPNVRAKFGLPRKPRKPRTAHTSKPATLPLPAHQKWWRGLPKEMRDFLIRVSYKRYKNGE